MTTWNTDIYGEGEPLQGELARGAYISTTRIILVSIISMGLFWIYWMYRTWKQYRDHTIEMAAETGHPHYPVWHSLTQFVPVYGWFRYHAHIRHYKELMVEQGVPDTLNLNLLTTVVVINGIVGILGGTMRSPDLYSGGVLLAGSILSIVALIVSIVVLCVMQSNLNRYWAAVDGRLAQSARFGKGEVVCIVLGVLFWAGVVADLVWS